MSASFLSLWHSQNTHNFAQNVITISPLTMHAKNRYQRIMPVFNVILFKKKHKKIALIRAEQEKIKKSPDGKVFAREDTKDKFIGIVQRPHLTSPPPPFSPPRKGAGGGGGGPSRGTRAGGRPPPPPRPFGGGEKGGGGRSGGGAELFQ